MKEIKKEESRQLVLHIFGEIKEDLAYHITNQVMKYYTIPYDEIVILINSAGGNTAIGFHLYDFILSLNKPIKTITLGDCHSMATILFSLGYKRYISENTIYLLHSASLKTTAFPNLNNNDFVKGKNLIDILDTKLIKILYNNSHLSSEELINIFEERQERYWEASEVLEKGFATDMLVNLNDIITNPINF